MVLVAALPSASNVALLAERFGADTGRIARIILLTTAAAFLTFSGSGGAFALSATRAAHSIRLSTASPPSWKSFTVRVFFR